MMFLMVSYFVLSFFHEISWMRSGTELSQLLRIFLPTPSESFIHFERSSQNSNKVYR